MVVMTRWRPWQPLIAKKFQVKLILQRLEGFEIVSEEVRPRLMVGIRWKGSKFGLSSLRRSEMRNFTKEEEVRSDGVVDWNEEFQCVLNFSGYKENVFLPWEITFTIFNVLNQRSKDKEYVVGTTLLNLAEYVSVSERKELEIKVPLTMLGDSSKNHSLLCLSLNLLELRTTQEPSETVQRSIVPFSHLSRESQLTEKDGNSVQEGLKLKILNYLSNRRAKKACREEGDSSESRISSPENGECVYPFDTESPEDFEDEELENKDDSIVRKSFTYGSLAHANCTGESYYSEMRMNREYEDWVYYSNRKSDVGSLNVEDTKASLSDQSFLQSSKRSILSWKKRKLRFRSPKPKGEPLLKKAYGEEGGDDIDFDRRQLNSSDESSSGRQKGNEESMTNRSSISEFGDDNFAIGKWEQKEVVSRDGQMKVQTQVFFASIDQRSERASGESACTALVALIADWFQINQDIMPIKSQFDNLIRDGSREWRNLCENEIYRERFPDKHFDLETVLEAKICSLTVNSQKSFIGFFHPEGIDEGSGFDFLHGAMCFEKIWDEISSGSSDCQSNIGPRIYIVSWNDHFFVLRVERDAYYIIDTLGERLYEGCNQAYILKFDRDTIIQRVSQELKSSSKYEHVDDKKQIVPESSEVSDEEVQVLSQGKESCREYIKNFLAAIPIRELQVDIKKGLMDSTHIHQRLQIEFHYTEFLQPVPSAAEAAAERSSKAVTTEGSVAT